MADQPVVGIIMGSKSDLATMEGCTAELERLGVPYELVIASAHRTPDKVHQWAETAADRGLKVIIAAAGKAAHLGTEVKYDTPITRTITSANIDRLRLPWEARLS